MGYFSKRLVAVHAGHIIVSYYKFHMLLPTFRGGGTHNILPSNLVSLLHACITVVGSTDNKHTLREHVQQESSE